ncbi:hypothetical protein HETIRDRAFT_426131 [Heterobasidion irregulare TC 32-1]|uniref:Uncharacterized protein n=1 Tax=Heterobasidion irregulare (strain TC 32-1) TaxID=747525 RepID=W4K9E1_HETIT|nr:uncharacterized protein HETIRDRAFT_426131 [Heterobasidion irregulare TC 32-1]ETW82452.1 hypothetical protein HETIRDRAFT_426131 [Heterobasidion irregulare TC 32-1]
MIDDPLGVDDQAVVVAIAAAAVMTLVVAFAAAAVTTTPVVAAAAMTTPVAAAVAAAAAVTTPLVAARAALGLAPKIPRLILKPPRAPASSVISSVQAQPTHLLTLAASKDTPKNATLFSMLAGYTKEPALVPSWTIAHDDQSHVAPLMLALPKIKTMPLTVVRADPAAHTAPPEGSIASNNMELNNAIARNNEVEERLDEMGQEMANMKAEVNALKAETRERSAGRDGSDTGQRRNNILSSFWICSLLMKQEYCANEAGWAKNVVAGVQMDGAHWNPSMNQTKLAELMMPMILAVIHITFSSWVKAYKKSKKPIVDQSIVRQKQQCNGHKTQSTDELEEETLTGAGGNGGLDPQTNNEGPISHNAQIGVSKLGKQKPVSHKPYLMHAPMDHVAQIQFYSIVYYEISHVSSPRQEYGAPREKGLPVSKKITKPKIPHFESALLEEREGHFGEDDDLYGNEVPDKMAEPWDEEMWRARTYLEGKM